MSCSPRTRERVREAAAELRACDGVVAVDVLAPSEGLHARWSLELVTTDHLDAPVLERLAANRLELADVSPQGENYHALASP